MAKHIHNLTENDLRFKGITVPAQGFFEIPRNLVYELSQDPDLLDAITNRDCAMSQDGVEDIGNYAAEIKFLKHEFQTSVAVDKNGVDQTINGDDWVEITASRALWDLFENYDLDTNDLKVDIAGVYFFDLQLRVDQMVNVRNLELAIFKRQEPEDDYWFILDKEPDPIEATELQMSAATSFDFYAGERYCLKIKLTKDNVLLGCSARIVGDDDYTAWGFSMTKEFA